jgi:hypothetical protein
VLRAAIKGTKSAPVYAWYGSLFFSVVPDIAHPKVVSITLIQFVLDMLRTIPTPCLNVHYRALMV